MWFPPVYFYRLDLSDNAIVNLAQSIQDTRQFGHFIGIAMVAVKFVIEEVTSLGHDCIAVNVIDAGQQQMIRVDQVVRNGWKVGFDTQKQIPTEVKDITRCARRLSVKKRFSINLRKFSRLFPIETNFCFLDLTTFGGSMAGSLNK